ncbi:MAG TPA: TetR/AcrR family transcriptional regulator [Streptosporangiaceae bacterium]|nr:TetR/AcrR family transcriptional regulator [Streptosporangiaceae bacterium]
MPRPKSQSDEQVLDAALALVRSSGVDHLTFAALAERCGLSAATLVQRFGTKPGLTQRALLHAWDKLQARTLELASSVPKTPDGAIEFLVGLSHHDGDIEAYAEGLLILREDLRDPVLRSRGAAWETAVTTAISACFASVPDTPSGIGFALAAHWQGALTWWAFGAQRRLDDYLTESLRSLISMLLRSPGQHHKAAP